jgi:hypothetical protein
MLSRLGTIQSNSTMLMSQYRHGMRDLLCCGVSMAVGDVLCQSIKTKTVNIDRTKRMGLIGLTTSGFLAVLVHRSLERYYPGKSGALPKFIFQTLIAPLQIANTFMTNLYYSGERKPYVYREKLKDVLPTFGYGFMFWPFVHMFLFKKVHPTNYIVFHSIASVIWGGFVSSIANK